MRRFQLGLAAIAVPVFAFTLFLVGCSKDEKKDSASSSGGDVAKDKQPKGDLKVVEAKGGVLKGKITIKGTPDTAADTKKVVDGIADLKDQGQKERCNAGSETEKTGQSYRVNDEKRLGNVFVWIKPADGTFFKVDAKALEDAKKPVVIRQPHCASSPTAPSSSLAITPIPRTHARRRRPARTSRSSTTPPSATTPIGRAVPRTPAATNLSAWASRS